MCILILFYYYFSVLIVVSEYQRTITTGKRKYCHNAKNKPAIPELHQYASISFSLCNIILCIIDSSYGIVFYFNFIFWGKENCPLN